MMLFTVLCAPAFQLRTIHPLGSSSQRRSRELSCSSILSGTDIQYSGIHHVGLVVGSAKEALQFYTTVLGMTDDTDADHSAFPQACVRVGAHRIYLMETSSPDPVVDRPPHAGRDRHIAITLHDLGVLQNSLDVNRVNYTMSFSGRQALFCRDIYGNGLEFGPASTFASNTHLFPKYLEPNDPQREGTIEWGGLPHVGILGADSNRAKQFYCGVLQMLDENDLRPTKLPFPGLFLRCGEQQVHFMELPNPDPDTVDSRPPHGRDRRTAFSVKDLNPVMSALEEAQVAYSRSTWCGHRVLYCRDPDANELMLVEDQA